MGRDFDWNQLDASFNAPSLFSARRLVEVRLPSGKPGKEGGEVISQFCANPAPDVILMITANEWSKAHQGKWAEAVNRVGVLSVAWAIKPHELPDWIERRLRSRSLRAEPAAVQRLAERVEGNLLAAAQEIDKLALLADGQTLDVERMESLVADAARYDVFRLVEATFSGQPQAVLRMLAGLRGEGEAVAALMPIVIRELLAGAGLARVQARGGNLAAEMKSVASGNRGRRPTSARCSGIRKASAGSVSWPKQGWLTASPRGAPTAMPGLRLSACWWRWPRRARYGCSPGPDP